MPAKLPSSIRRVLVTGAGGFIGRHLVHALRGQDVEVLCPTRREWDIASEGTPDLEADHIFHLAAVSGVPDSWQNPQRFYGINALGTVNVLEFCRKTKCSLTYVSAYCYGIPERLPIREDDPVRPNNPYAFSKFSGEEACRFYRDRFAVPVTIIRPFNVYGPGQNDTFLLPQILAQALDSSKSAIEVLDLVPKRDFVFVSDLVDALLASTRGAPYALFNVGSGQSYSVEELIRTCLSVLGSSKPYKSLQAPRSYDIPDVVADTSAIWQVHRWKPQIDLPEGIRRTVESMRPR